MAYTASGTLASSVALTANALVLGGGAGATPTPLASLGTTTTVLHGNAGGAPTFGAVSLTADVTGNLPVGNLNSGTSASGTTFWRGDGVWGVPAGTATGTVANVSVVSANGFAGTVATSTTTPAITLTTSISGVLKGNGAAISAATSGTDYLAPPSGTAILKANSGGALANATAGTDYVAPGTATTFTATQTFSGTSSVLASILTNAVETTNIVAGTNTANPIAYFNNGAVNYYTGNNSSNWTQDLSFSSGTTLDAVMAIGQSITIAILSTNTTTAYYPSAYKVDNVSVTPKWQGGTAPAAGNASSIDVYMYTILKTGNAAFTVFASQTKFA